MNKKYTTYLIVGLLSLTYTGLLNAQSVYYETNFNAKALARRAIPTGHVPGKDNGTGEGLHATGEDCGKCHTPNGRAGHVIFTVGGTLYEDRQALKPLVGAEVILQDVDGNVISMTSNEVGNFWSYAPIASNPFTLASHGTDKEALFAHDEVVGTVEGETDPGDSRSWLYKAWIRNPDGAVRPMITIAPIGGATGTSPRMGCNMHHNPLAATGATWASRKSSLSSYPSSGLSFKRDIQPIFESKCAPCHKPGTGKSRLVTVSDVYTSTFFDGVNWPLIVDATNTALTSIEYGAYRDFTSYSGTWNGTTGEKGIDYFAKTSPAEYTPAGGAINYQSNPDESPLLCKTKINPDCQVPTATNASGFDTLPHGGGTFWAENDADYKAIRQWIIEGAQNN